MDNIITQSVMTGERETHTNYTPTYISVYSH